MWGVVGFVATCILAAFAAVLALLITGCTCESLLAVHYHAASPVSPPRGEAGSEAGGGVTTTLPSAEGPAGDADDREQSPAEILDDALEHLEHRGPAAADP